MGDIFKDDDAYEDDSDDKDWSGEDDGYDTATMNRHSWPTLRQFCVFLENRVGKLHELLRHIERHDLRVVALSIVDTVDFAVARVMVNRLWHYHFGQGLIKTPNDFGFNGGHPSHPKLLDWLAAEFRTSGWSLKAMHRLIVSSAAYQQSSRSNPEAAAVDADNVFVWR